jgi:hypothetical protein
MFSLTWCPFFGVKPTSVIYSITALDNKINFSQIQIVVPTDSLLYPDLWKLYSLNSILTKYGKPSDVWVILTVGEVDPIKTYYELWLFYEDEGLLIKYYDIAIKVLDNYEVCPNQMADSTVLPFNRVFTLQSQGNEEPLEDTYQHMGGTMTQYYPIQEATGLNVQEFYDLILTGNTTACFSIPRAIWP